MKVKVKSGIVAAMLLLSTIALAFNTQPIYSSNSGLQVTTSLGPIVAVNPIVSTAEPGEYFTIIINITDAVDVYQWSFEFWWSVPSLLDIDKVNLTEGPFLEAGGGTLFNKAVFTSSGFYIKASCSLLGWPGPLPWDPKPQSGSGALASATFKVISPGKHALELRNVHLVCWNWTTETTYNVFPDVADGDFYTTTPYSRFTFSPNPSEEGNYGRPIVGETVTFNASQSYDPDGGTITSYEWDFDDGSITTVSTPIINHAYDAEGDYIVKLTVTDDDGESYSWQHLIKINLHDIAVIAVTPLATMVFPGDLVEVNVTVLNEGNSVEALNVTLRVDGGPVNTTRFTWRWWKVTWWGGFWVYGSLLSMGEYATTTITWNTTGFSGGVYAISANASLVRPVTQESVRNLEQDMADNELFDGTIALISWEHIFEDPYRGIILKVSTDDKHFQFTAPDKDFGIKHDPDMTVGPWGHLIVISYEDSKIKLWALAIDASLDFCVVFAKDLQTGQFYWLVDRPDGWILGDIDRDADVDRYDFFLFADAYGSSGEQPSYNPEADFDGNDRIDRYDFFAFADNYGKTAD